MTHHSFLQIWFKIKQFDWLHGNKADTVLQWMNANIGGAIMKQKNIHFSLLVSDVFLKGEHRTCTLITCSQSRYVLCCRKKQHFNFMSVALSQILHGRVNLLLMGSIHCLCYTLGTCSYEGGLRLFIKLHWIWNFCGLTAEVRRTSSLDFEVNFKVGQLYERALLNYCSALLMFCCFMDIYLWTINL